MSHDLPAGLRVVVLTTFLANYRVLAEWSARRGHTIPLIVTLPAANHPRVADLAPALPKQTNLLMTGDLTSVAAPAIGAVLPDLLISAGFPRRIPASLLTLPRYGALNLHPTALPGGRGPNPMRPLYEGVETLGATLHRTAAEFDTGAILSQRQRPLPDPLTGPAIFDTWLKLFAEVIDEGVARAVAGEPGVPQDEGLATYAPHFTDAEQVLDLTEPAKVIRRRAAALNVLGPSARVRLPGYHDEVVVSAVEILPGPSLAAPGTHLASDAVSWTVQSADRRVRLWR